MTTPRIRTIAETATRWFLWVGEGAGLHQYGPFKKAGRVKWLEDHLRESARRHGWPAALAAGEGDVPFEDPTVAPPAPPVAQPEQLGLVESYTNP